MRRKVRRPSMLLVRRQYDPVAVFGGRSGHIDGVVERDKVSGEPTREDILDASRRSDHLKGLFKNYFDRSPAVHDVVPVGNEKVLAELIAAHSALSFKLLGPMSRAASVGVKQNPVDVEGQRKHRDDLRAPALPARIAQHTARRDLSGRGTIRPEPRPEGRTNNLHFFVVKRTKGGNDSPQEFPENDLVVIGAVEATDARLFDETVLRVEGTSPGVLLSR